MAARFVLKNLVTAPASDDELVEALIAYANGSDVLIAGQDRRFGEPHSQAKQRDTYIRALERVVGGRPTLPMLLDDATGRLLPALAAIRLGRNASSLPPELRAMARVKAERVLVARPGGYSLAYYRHFPSVAGALSEAVVLIQDPARPYAKALCRCQYPACQNFYFARKNPRGGPANRTYCDPEHRRLHNNSAARKRQ
ncbi:MAG TPA: hypothetical protein VJ738_05360 [Steroidobacteraceae bacterium]|nr:hypothetical protein [Steroidobacteraceae bacterium]